FLRHIHYYTLIARDYPLYLFFILYIVLCFFLFFFFFNDTATTEIYTLSLQRRSSDLIFTSGFDVVGLLFSPRSGLRYILKQQCKDRKSTRLNSSHRTISYAVFCLKKKM